LLPIGKERRGVRELFVRKEIWRVFSLRASFLPLLSKFIGTPYDLSEVRKRRKNSGGISPYGRITESRHRSLVGGDSGHTSRIEKVGGISREQES